MYHSMSFSSLEEHRDAVVSSDGYMGLYTSSLSLRGHGSPLRPP